MRWAWLVDGMRMLIDGEEVEQVSALDRGLSYGDGLFESIRLVGGRAPLWARHMRRLLDSCARLRLAPPDPENLWHEASRVSAGLVDCVVRISVSRGVGERGYALPPEPQSMRIVAAFAPPAIADADLSGIRMRQCALRLAEQPLLAGMKHLNRLEQVLARAEWSDPAITEGLLLDGAGRVISAIMANLFAVVDGIVLTPSLERCGVAGVARAEVLAQQPDVRVGDLSLESLHRASEVFLSSSVRGIMPVHSIDHWRFTPAGMTYDLQRHWRNLGFSMEQAG